MTLPPGPGEPVDAIRTDDFARHLNGSRVADSRRN